MLIRTGILCIPQPDEEAVRQVGQRLRQALPNVHLIYESSAASQRHWIEEILRRWCDEEEIDLALTIGGTLPASGPSVQEITPEATLAVIERALPGLPEEMRAYASEQTPLALLDRGVAGIRGRSLLINLPAGAGPALHFLEAIVDLIEPILAHLQERPDAPRLADAFATDTSDADSGQNMLIESQNLANSPRLNDEEFRAFLRRKSQTNRQVK